MKPYLQDADVTLYQGDCLDVLRQLPSESVHCAITSPPFYGLRDYSACPCVAEGRLEVSKDDGRGDRHTAGGAIAFHRQGEPNPDCAKCEGTGKQKDLAAAQIGMEETPEQWVAKLVAVFREVRRVLRSDGVMFLEVGDSYAHSGACGGSSPDGPRGGRAQDRSNQLQRGGTIAPGYKPKDLIGAPWLLAFALRADGWYLRSEIIWSKSNPMPESVSDRPTTAHSRIFLFAKQPRYFFDAEAVREPHAPITLNDRRFGTSGTGRDRYDDNGEASCPSGFAGAHPAGRNIRSVWELATEAFSEAHFATFPTRLVTRCILAGSSERGCCPECGAPWVREVEVESSWRSRSEGGATRGNLAPEGLVGAGTQRAVHGAGVSHDLDSRRREFRGWRPSCECGRADAIPATVLDCFAGSGTTALVARKLGRRCIGIDLNADYLAMASRRLAQQSLFATEVA